MMRVTRFRAVIRLMVRVYHPRPTAARAVRISPSCLSRSSGPRQSDGRHGIARHAAPGPDDHQAVRVGQAAQHRRRLVGRRHGTVGRRPVREHQSSRTVVRHVDRQSDRPGRLERASEQPGDERPAEQHEADHRGHRVAGQAEVQGGAPAGEEHRASGAHVDPVDEELGADAVERTADVVGRRPRRPAGGHDEALAGGVQDPGGVVGVVGHPLGGHRLGAGRAEHRGQRVREDVADLPRAGHAAADDLVAEHRHPGGRGGRDEHVVDAGGRGQCRSGRREDRAAGEEHLPERDLLARWSDVATRRGRVPDEEPGVVDRGVLGADHGVGARRHGGPGRDRPRVPGRQAFGRRHRTGDDGRPEHPRAVTGDRPAVHRGTVVPGDRARREQVADERPSERTDQVEPHRTGTEVPDGTLRGEPTALPVGLGAGVVPGEEDRRHRASGSEDPEGSGDAEGSEGAGASPRARARRVAVAAASLTSALDPPRSPAAYPARKVVSGAAGRATPCAASRARSSTTSRSSVKSSGNPSASASSAVHAARTSSVVMRSVKQPRPVGDPRGVGRFVHVRTESGGQRDLDDPEVRGQPPDRRTVGIVERPDRRTQRVRAVQGEQRLPVPALVDRDEPVGVVTRVVGGAEQLRDGGLGADEVAREHERPRCRVGDGDEARGDRGDRSAEGRVLAGVDDPVGGRAPVAEPDEHDRRCPSGRGDRVVRQRQAPRDERRLVDPAHARRPPACQEDGVVRHAHRPGHPCTVPALLRRGSHLVHQTPNITGGEFDAEHTEDGHGRRRDDHGVDGSARVRCPGPRRDGGSSQTGRARHGDAGGRPGHLAVRLAPGGWRDVDPRDGRCEQHRLLELPPLVAEARLVGAERERAGAAER
ncbi:hypothetical protein Cus16_2534 [Curtobacterium sp. ER1/6]|nr:hypothetical protein Cus16_2534 [Curtobacterium sp. ER1/6]